MQVELDDKEKELILGLIATLSLRSPDEVVATALMLRRKLTVPNEPTD